MSERASLPVEAVAVQRVAPKVVWLRWVVCLALTPVLLVPFVWLFLVWGVLRLFAWINDPRRALRRARPGAIEVDGDVLAVERRGEVARFSCAALADGWLEPVRGGTAVILRFRDGIRIVARCRELADARRLLRAAGVSADRRVLEVPLGSLAAAKGYGAMLHLLGPILGGVLALTALAALSVGGRGNALFLLLSFTVIGALLWTLTPGRAFVGADGVTVAHLFRRRFIPYKKIVRVRPTARGVLLVTGDGPVSLETRRVLGDPPVTHQALAARLREAIEIFHSDRPSRAKRELFARSGQSVAAWREGLHKRLGADVGYRRFALEDDEIARIAGDPANAPEQRIGAALSLSGRPIDPALRERLRVAAGATANRPLRIALDKALDGQLEDEDLAAFEAERRRAAKRKTRS